MESWSAGERWCRLDRRLTEFLSGYNGSFTYATGCLECQIWSSCYHSAPPACLLTPPSSNGTNTPRPLCYYHSSASSRLFTFSSQFSSALLPTSRSHLFRQLIHHDCHCLPHERQIHHRLCRSPLIHPCSARIYPEFVGRGTPQCRA